MNERSENRGGFASGLADAGRFLGNWARRPLLTGAVSPSGRALARAMAGLVDLELPGAVVELGPGTGPVTRALLERVPADRLVSIEFNPDFCKLLRERHPDVRIVEGDAYGIRETLGQAGVGAPLAAVVSSLPLFTSPLEDRKRLIHAALDMLSPGGVFIQFSYALVPAIPPEPARFTTDVGRWILMNIPPARVWTFTKPR
jgi:phosphatidylethanolamine/phosphatidyl-N-methylethanolamine N-methyltransferase